MKKIDFLIIFSLVIISLFTLKDLFKPGLFTSHDGIHQVVRLYYFDQAIREGQIPPRFTGGLLNGFGYPLFIFSYHLPWMIAEPIHLMGLSIIDAVKMTFLIGFILSGVALYFFQREIFGKLAAFTGMMIYLFAPNRFLNIFVRAAIGDATTYIFLPVLFLCLYKLKGDKVRSIWLILGALSLAGILLSHAMVFFFVILAVSLYFLYSILFIQRKREFTVRFIVMIVLTFGLSGYYFFPSLLERDNTKFYEIMSSVFSGNTLLKLSDLLYSPWGYGTLFSKEGAMSLQLGIAQWLVVIVSAGVLLFLRNYEPKEKLLRREAIYYLLVVFISIFLMMELSLGIWKIVSKYILIDFPWRIFPLTIFSIAMLAGFVIKKIKYPILFAILFISLSIYANRNHLRINQTLDWPLPFYLQLEKTTNSYDEYTPKWVQSNLIEKPQIQKFQFSDTLTTLNLLKAKSNYYEINYKTEKPTSVRFNTVYYPGWEVFVNGKKTEIRSGSGFMDFEVSDKEGKIIAKFGETDIRQISNLVTLLSIGIMILILLKFRYI